MDDVQGDDPHMGASLKQYRFLYNNGTELQKEDAPNPSDDNKAHNWHFGMTYQINFTIGDYTGPMEYYFRGDDDFWLYIDGQLAIDIGGVHSSQGETLDLRDWMQKKGMLSDKNKEHTMNIFYMERGGFGSCCYMQFTIPNSEPVTVPTPETTTYKVTKDWDDDNNQFRPQSIVVELQQVDRGTSKNTGVYVELTEKNNWTYVWDSLPKINGSTQGKYEYSYQVREISLPEGYTPVVGVDGNLKNTLERVKIKVKKDWLNDKDLEEQYRPESITVQLYADGEPYKGKTGNGDEYKQELNESNNWQYIFDNLPQYRYEKVQDNTTGYYTYEGIPIKYSIRELDSNGKPIENSEGQQGTLTFNGKNGAKYEVTYSPDVEAKPDNPDNPDDISTLTVTNTLLTSFEIVKKASVGQTGDVGETVEGAEFTLTPISAGTTYYGISNAVGLIEWKIGSVNGSPVDRIAEGQYTLKETKAPVGYLLSTEKWTITVDGYGKGSVKAKDGSDITKVVSTASDGTGTVVFTFTFYNEVFYQLPSTGGSGIYWYSIGGVLLMLAATLILYKNRYKGVLVKK